MIASTAPTSSPLVSSTLSLSFTNSSLKRFIIWFIFLLHNTYTLLLEYELIKLLAHPKTDGGMATIYQKVPLDSDSQGKSTLVTVTDERERDSQRDKRDTF